MAKKFLDNHPISGARNVTVKEARLAAVDCMLSNLRNGVTLIVPNYSKILAEDFGFSRQIFLAVLEHFEKLAFIGREGTGYTRSIIQYSHLLQTYRPARIHYRPKPLIVNLKDEGVTLTKIDKAEGRQLKQRLKNVCDFYLQHEISSGIDRETFEIFNQFEIEVEKKPSLDFPDSAKIFPQIIFSDRDLTKGGRMYVAFWIGEKKVLRRAITIDGELTSDIDGKAMHVQLLYRLKGIDMPAGDPYLFADKTRRSVTKKLMLLMMNTKREMSNEDGRKAVRRTFRKHYGNPAGLEELILQLEFHHQEIADQFYKPNWGNLQKHEAAIMLDIMEAGMADGVVVLPVHDGCLCPRRHKDKVLGYFNSKGIVAVENLEHRQKLPIEEAKDALAAVRKFSFASNRKISVCTTF
ncbi:MAG: hypothetical protein WBB19_02125 [Desulforhopalus sp.]